MMPPPTMPRRKALAAWCLLALASSAHAQHPIVPAFERFHASSPDATGGRLLLSELNCVQCHADPNIHPKGAPILDGIGARLQASWIRDLLTDSRRAHLGTTMPDVPS